MILFALLAAVAVVYAVISEFAPADLNPFTPPDLAMPDAWFLDARLARLRRDRGACKQTLKPDIVAAQPISDAPYKDGCGWSNAVRVSSVGGARLPIEATSCEMAAALSMWAEHVVQPAAEEHFGVGVGSVTNFGGYACRNIIGSKFWGDFRSQHATANALDISAFTLADGQRIVVRTDWKGDGAAAQFLRDIHRGACRYFRAVLGPEHNAAHHDHFHFDRGYIKSCK